MKVSGVISWGVVANALIGGVALLTSTAQKAAVFSLGKFLSYPLFPTAPIWAATLTSVVSTTFAITAIFICSKFTKDARILKIVGIAAKALVVLGAIFLMPQYALSIAITELISVGLPALFLLLASKSSFFRLPQPMAGPH